MFRPQDVTQFTRAQPFKPFRIHQTDGQTFDVHHPDMAIVALRDVVVGTVDDRRRDIATRVTHVSLVHIVRIELLEPATPGTSAG